MVRSNKHGRLVKPRPKQARGALTSSVYSGLKHVGGSQARPASSNVRAVKIH